VTRSLLRLLQTAERARKAIDDINDGLPNEQIKIILGDLKRMAGRDTSPQRSIMLSLLDEPPNTGRLIENSLWETLNKDSSSKLPNLDNLRSLRTYKTVYRFEIQSCGYAAWQIVNRLTMRRGIKPAPGFFLRLAASTANGTAMRDCRPGPYPGTLKGDVIYQTGVLHAVMQMKHIIDAGHPVYARVLSGLGYRTDLKPDPNAKPQPLYDPPPMEHYIIVIGYDKDSFVFSDPDANVSHDPEPGFAMLYYDSADNRLSTASGRWALFVTPPDGYHALGDKRYQVITLQTYI
jgi:hypothetical protein